MKVRHKVCVAVLVALYAVTWIFGHSAVHESIDVAEGRIGKLRTTTFPILPCVLFCSSGNMIELGGRSAIGLYFWYGFGVKKIIEIPMVVA